LYDVTPLDSSTVYGAELSLFV